MLTVFLPQKMLFIALIITLASAQTYTTLTSYPDATCTGAAVAVITVSSGAPCAPTNCTNGYRISCGATNGTATSTMDCGFDNYSVANCGVVNLTQVSPTTGLRFTTGQCHNIDSATLPAALAGVAAGFLCPAAYKSVRPMVCQGEGQFPGFPSQTQCFSDVNCGTLLTTTFQSTGTTTTVANTTTGTPPPSLQCKICNTPGMIGAASSYSFCAATTTTTTMTTAPSSSARLLVFPAVLLALIVAFL